MLRTVISLIRFDMCSPTLNNINYHSNGQTGMALDRRKLCLVHTSLICICLSKPLHRSFNRVLVLWIIWLVNKKEVSVTKVVYSNSVTFGAQSSKPLVIRRHGDVDIRSRVCSSQHLAHRQ